MTKPILLLNGPNLDFFGLRNAAVYGTTTFDELVSMAAKRADGHGYELEHLQTASEAEMVQRIHSARGRCAAIVINGGAFTHYAWALRDALDLFEGPIVELHMSNVHARETWRHTSVIAPVATGTIAGLGAHGYELAVDAVVAQIAQR